MARVYPVWYLTGEDGLPVRRPDATPVLRARVLELARVHGVEVWPLISNHSAARGEFDPDLMRRVMGDASLRRAHIRNLLDRVREDGGQGVDLDYENLHDADRDAFSAFVAEIAEAFHGAGLRVGIAVHAKGAEPGTPGGSRAQDYAALARSCDRLQIMGYDYHWSTGPAGPIGPPQWCSEVLAHALTQAPAERIEWGLPGYGNNWGGGVPATGVHWDAWERLVQEHPPARRDPETAELTLRFDGREVWMNDAISLTAKLWQMRVHGVREAALWVLGAEDPRWWALLETLPADFLGTEAR
jgi:spore germination protein YaaH